MSALILLLAAATVASGIWAAIEIRRDREARREFRQIEARERALQTMGRWGR